MGMSIRELLVERYAPLRGLSDRSVAIFGDTIDRLGDFLERTPVVEDFTDLTMAQYLRWRSTRRYRGRPVAPATIAKDRAHLVALANLAARKRLIPEFVDFPRLRVPIKPPRGYTVDEVSAIIREGRTRRGSVGPVPSAWFWMTLPWAAWESGERIGSLLRLRWGEVDLDRRVLVLLGEHRKDHITTIERHITADLAQRMAPQRRSDSEVVWPWLEHRRENSVYTSLRKLCQAAGVVPRGFHAIRKASGSYVKAGGGDASEHLAHASPRTTSKHYLDSRIVGTQSALDYLPPLDLGGGPNKPR